MLGSPMYGPVATLAGLGSSAPVINQSAHMRTMPMGVEVSGHTQGGSFTSLQKGTFSIETVDAGPAAGYATGLPWGKIVLFGGLAYVAYRMLKR